VAILISPDADSKIDDEIYRVMMQARGNSTEHCARG
jgi:hypothetical protein